MTIRHLGNARQSYVGERNPKQTLILVPIALDVENPNKWCDGFVFSSFL